MPVVLAEGLQKRFGDTVALTGLDLSVERGTVLGVLGPNGAGKTTAVRILTTLLTPDAGRAVIDGVDVTAEPQRVRSRIGLTGQYAAVDERLTARENLELIGRFHRMSSGAARRRATELLNRFELVDAADRVVGGFSGGMRRRIDIAMSLVAEPVVLFLDEPTTGLDPRSRAAMWQLIDELVRDGMTMLLTTQYLDEADQLANDIVVIDHGRAIARGTADELKASIGSSTLQVTLTPGSTATAHEVASGLDGLRAAPVESATRVADVVTVPIRTGTTVIHVVQRLEAAGVAVHDLAIERPTLDDVFMTLTGHTADEPTAVEAPSGRRRSKKATADSGGTR